jgi:hypothetical protein
MRACHTIPEFFKLITRSRANWAKEHWIAVSCSAKERKQSSSEFSITSEQNDNHHENSLSVTEHPAKETCVTLSRIQDVIRGSGIVRFSQFRKSFGNPLNFKSDGSKLSL